MNKIKDFFYKNFVFKKKEKLSNLTILYILTLNILLIITLSIGSTYFKNFLDSPYLIIPKLCKNIISNEDILNTNNYFYHYKNYYSLVKSPIIDSRCNILIYDKLHSINADLYINSLVEKKNNYNINFNNTMLVRDFIEYINNHKIKILDDFISLQKFYNLKLELLYLLFNLPLFGVLFYMMRKYLLKTNYTLFITFKSVFYTIFINIVISIYNLISIVTPKGIIQIILDNSYKLEIHILFYYSLIILILIVFGYVIEKNQNRYKSKQKKCRSNNISRVVLHKCDDKI